VLIVDDHPVVRRGLRVLLEVQDGIEVAGEAGDGATALALAAELSPDVVLLDLKLPGMDGIAVLTQLKANGSQARVLVLTSATEPASASLALRSGAAGVVYKDVDPDALVRAIRSAGRISSRRSNPVRSTTTPSPTFPPPIALPAPRGTSGARWAEAQRTSETTSCRSVGTQMASGRIR